MPKQQVPIQVPSQDFKAGLGFRFRVRISNEGFNPGFGFEVEILKARLAFHGMVSRWGFKTRLGFQVRIIN